MRGGRERIKGEGGKLTGRSLLADQPLACLKLCAVLSLNRHNWRQTWGPQHSPRPARVSDASLIRFVDPGLVDTGADVTVIRDPEWPVGWPTVPSQELWGIGGSKPGHQSLSWVTVSKPGGRALATIRPFVLPVHLNIWGRDLLTKLDTTLDINI
ncbi:unnamed protein product [Eretmochelys imbricata]